jgi:hypothetical protein
MLTAGRAVPVSRAARASRSAPSDDLSLASAFSIGSAASVGSILSALSRWSILAWRSRGHAPLHAASGNRGVPRLILMTAAKAARLYDRPAYPQLPLAEYVR